MFAHGCDTYLRVSRLKPKCATAGVFECGVALATDERFESPPSRRRLHTRSLIASVRSGSQGSSSAEVRFTCTTPSVVDGAGDRRAHARSSYRVDHRRYMESHLGTLAEQASSRGKPLALMMLDIDFFKSINDNYGHDAGDDVLREFAVRIRKSIRGIDLACRYGGEEFVIVMPETDLRQSPAWCEALAAVRSPANPSRSTRHKTHRGHDLDRAVDPGTQGRGHRRRAQSAPTPRSTAPSTTAATAWFRRRRSRNSRRLPLCCRRRPPASW